MGAWGAGIFENDEAVDLGLEVANGEDGARLQSILLQAGTSVPYVDNDAGSRAAAAAAIVLALGGEPVKTLPAELSDWTAGHGRELTPSLCSLAIAAVDRVVRSSETVELWTESGDGDFWRGNMLDLRVRLQHLAARLHD
jgi:hypothetical protein